MSDLVLRILRQLQADMAEMKADMAAMKVDMATLRRDMVTKRDLRRALARFAAASAMTFVNADEFERLVERVEKLETRLPPVP